MNWRTSDNSKTTLKGGKAETILAIVVLIIVANLLIKLPPGLLSFFLVISLALSLVILLMSFYISKPLEFSTFPTILLLATTYRLTLNIASTKLILLRGAPGASFQSKAGAIIEFFGHVVAGNSPVVGFVVFLIIIVVQFIVITKGAARIAEVSARFTLDSLPGRQMAIDADLNAGLITDSQAREQRDEIRRESDFYGTMDGASKFVRGDAIAGMLITAINILGGIALGLWRDRMQPVDVLHTYTILTIGDGLVAQIPALLISLAAGIVITRAATETNLSRTLSLQVFGKPGVLYVAACFLFVFSLLGLVSGSRGVILPFLAVAVLLAVSGHVLQKSRQEEAREQVASERERREAIPTSPEEVEALLSIEPMEIEIGSGLLQIAGEGQAGLVDRIGAIRRQTALDFGIVVPPIRIRDNPGLSPNDYVIRMRGVKIDSGSVHPEMLLAMKPGELLEGISGEDTREPAFGLPAKWIDPEARDLAVDAGCKIVEPAGVMATHLAEVIQTNAAELLDRESVRRLVDRLRETSPSLVNDVIPNILSLGQFQRVLQNLLNERVSIRDLGAILEAVGEAAPSSKDIAQLTESARAALGRVLTQTYISADGSLHVIGLSQDLEKSLAGDLVEKEEHASFEIDPDVARGMVDKLAAQMRKTLESGHQPVLLTSPVLRPHLRSIVSRFLPRLAVLSYSEVPGGVNVKRVGVVDKTDEDRHGA